MFLFRSGPDVESKCLCEAHALGKPVAETRTRVSEAARINRRAKLDPGSASDADVCIVAEVLCRGPTHGVRWLAEHNAPSMPSVYAAGNHEFSQVLDPLRTGGRPARSAGGPGVHLLEDEIVTIRGVAFIGATLWTDYRIEGQVLAVRRAQERMNDNRQIAL